MSRSDTESQSIAEELAAAKRVIWTVRHIARDAAAADGSEPDAYERIMRTVDEYGATRGLRDDAPATESKSVAALVESIRDNIDEHVAAVEHDALMLPTATECKSVAGHLANALRDPSHAATCSSSCRPGIDDDRGECDCWVADARAALARHTECRSDAERERPMASKHRVKARNVHSTWLSDCEREIRMSVSIEDARRMIMARGRDGVLEVRLATATAQRSIADAAEAYVVLDSGGEQVGDTTYSEDEARYVAEWYGVHYPEHAPYRVLYAVDLNTECRSVAPSMGRVVGGFREGATSEGYFVPPKGHYNLVVQVANGSEPCPLYWTDVEIRPKKTDCGSVEGGE